MQVKHFTIPVLGGEALVEEMNTFLRGKKVIQVKQRFVGKKPDEACWTYAVRYVDDVAATDRERSKVDYRELLDAPAFNRFSALREIRKAVAQEHKVPPYVVFTDYELSEIAKLEDVTLEAMLKVKGIGESKVEKYGRYFLPKTTDASPPNNEAQSSPPSSITALFPDA
ncbi:MAG: HRDC domain-containing protein [Saprospiraceae bacterium]|nr:HRDC domain-containing protein [Saprospiraceae bacterium]